MNKPADFHVAWRGAQSQRGSVAIAVAGVLLLSLILLGSVQIGYLAYVKRELQKTADAAALSSIQILGEGTQQECNVALMAAGINVHQNYAGLAPDDVQAECGVWDEGSESFRLTTAADGKHDAIRVQIHHTTSGIVPFVSGTPLVVQAVASIPLEPVAVFSVGPRLLDFDHEGALVTGLLNGLLGLDLSGLKVLSDHGILDAEITIGGLLQALGIRIDGLTVGDLNSLLALEELSLLELVQASLRAAHQDEFLHVGAELVHAIGLDLGVDDLNLQLGGENGGLFAQIGTQSVEGALSAKVKLGELLGTAIGVATKDNAVSVDLGVNLGIANASVQTRLIEPPSIAVGVPGTTAYSSQLRTHIDLGLGTSPLLGDLLTVDLKLPLTLDVARGQATFLDSEGLCKQKDDQGRWLADIESHTELLGVCVGRHRGDPFSKTESCSNGLMPEKLLDLTLLFTPLLSLNTKIDLSVPPAGSEAETHAYYAGQSRMVPEDGSNLPLGQTVSHVVDAVLASLLAGGLEETRHLSRDEKRKIAEEFWRQADEGCQVEARNPFDMQAYECRRDRMERATSEIEQHLTGLQGFIGSLVDNLLGLLDGLLTLNMERLFVNLGLVLFDVLKAVGGLLQGVLTPIIGHIDSCAGFPGALNWTFSGDEQGCINKLTDLLDQNPAGDDTPNALLVLLGALLGLLEPILDGVGHLLTEILRKVLGVELLQSEVRLISLQCSSGAPRLMQ